MELPVSSASWHFTALLHGSITVIEKKAIAHVNSACDYRQKLRSSLQIIA